MNTNTGSEAKVSLRENHFSNGWLLFQRLLEEGFQRIRQDNGHGHMQIHRPITKNTKTIIVGTYFSKNE